MTAAWRKASLSLFLFSILLFASTFLETRDAAIIPFSTASGHSGTVTLDLPRRVFSGDAVRLSARVGVSRSTSDTKNLGIVARMEAGFEELAPVGRVTLNMRSGSEVELIWRLRTGKTAAYPATLWLWLTSDAGEELLLAREFTLDSRRFLGLTVSPVRILSGCLTGVAMLMAGYGRLRRPGKKRT